MGNADALFDLAASISVDDSQSDKALADNQKKVAQLTDSYNKLSSAAKGSLGSPGDTGMASLNSLKGRLDSLKAGMPELKGKAAELRVLQNELKATGAAARVTAGVVRSDLQGALSTLSPALGGVAAAAGPLTAVAVGLAAIAATAAGVYKLATYSAQLGGEIFDLSQKVNFTAETLSSLKVAAELSGGSLASLSTSLGIFDRNMEEAKDKTSEMSIIFKTLKIDTDNNEKALRQAFTVLVGLAGGAQQTAIAMKLFGRSGKEVLGIVKESNGDIDAYIDKMRELGFVITSDGAKKMDAFGDSLTMVRNQLEAVGRQIGQELIPLVSKAASDVSSWLKANQGELQKTASEFATLLSWVYKVAKAIADVSPVTFIVRVVTSMSTVSEGSAQGALDATLRGASGGYKSFQNRVNPIPYNPAKARINWGETAPGQREGEFAIPGSVPPTPKEIVFPKKGGGGGGGGKGSDPAATARKLAELQLKTLLDGIKAEEDALKRSLSTRRLSLESFTEQAIALAYKERAAVIEGIDAQIKAASKLKSGRAVAVAELQLKKQEQERKSTASIIEEIDRLQDDLANRDRVREEGMLRIKGITSETEKDLWQRLSDQRVIMAETAVKAIGEIERAGLVRQFALARSEFNRAGNDKTKQLEASMKMGEIESQIGALAINLEHRAADALKARIQLQREFNATLEQTKNSLQLQSLQLAKQTIQHGVEIGTRSPRMARRAIDTLDVEGANLQNQAAKRQLFLTLMKDMEAKSFAERTELYAQFVIARDALEAQHAQVITEIMDRPLIELRAKLADLASSVTSSIDSALRAGFESGIQAGLVTFAQGILEMIRSAALQALEKRLFDVFSNALGGGASSGGGWLGKALGIALGVAAGAAGGGGGKSGGMAGVGGKYAEGGFAQPNTWNLVGEEGPELIRTGKSGATVLPNSAVSGVVHNHYHNWNIVTRDAQSFASQPTQYQIQKRLHDAVSKSALLG